MAAEKREVSREDYFAELSSLGVKGRRRLRLLHEYRVFLGRLSGVARRRLRLIARLPYAGIIERVMIGDRIRELDSLRVAYLTQARHIHTTEIPFLEDEIRTEMREFRRKKRPPPPPPPPPIVKLYRIKIRLYNEERKPTPTGMFQTFWDVDAIIDPETGLVDWDWHLTKDEIQICKYHMIGYFKGLAKWRSPEQTSLAYFDEPTGIPYEEKMAKYKYSKNVPIDFIAKAEALTVGELIVGISSVEPRLVTEPEGVFFERAMIIDADGVIKWDEIRNKFVWKPTKSQIEEIKKELKMK